MKTKVITGRDITTDDLTDCTLIVTTEYQKITSRKLCGEFKMQVLTRYYLAIGVKYNQYQVAYTLSELTFHARSSWISEEFFLTQIKLLDTTINSDLTTDITESEDNIMDLKKVLLYTPSLEDVVSATKESIIDFVGSIFALSEEIHVGAYVDNDHVVLSKDMFDVLLKKKENENEME